MFPPTSGVFVLRSAAMQGVAFRYARHEYFQRSCVEACVGSSLRQSHVDWAIPPESYEKRISLWLVDGYGYSRPADASSMLLLHSLQNKGPKVTVDVIYFSLGHLRFGTHLV